MTVVEAPIGYGKTTAVREFLMAKNHPIVMPNKNNKKTATCGIRLFIELPGGPYRRPLVVYKIV